MIASCTEPTVTTTAAASNVAEQWKLLDVTPTSRYGWSLQFFTRRLAQHCSQAPEDARACGFHVLSAYSTLPATYSASLR